MTCWDGVQVRILKMPVFIVVPGNPSMTAPATKNALVVPMNRFGKDHWSIFAYAETCTVDDDGYLDARRLRKDGSKYPSFIKEGQQPDHSDIDCLNDLEAAGFLVFARASTIRRGLIDLTYHVTLTPLGQAVAAQLRQHKANGGQFSAFSPTEVPT